ncbi:MAG: gluconate 2-dehydrogenase subunit 3 family protein [Longimicrobiales bacterium]
MSDVTRRDALTVMSIVPLAAALGVTPDVIERAMQGVQQAQQQQTPFKPKFFSAHEWRTVRVLVDLIIPRDERSGSATDAGVPEFMDFIMIDRPGMQAQMRGGLRWLDNESVDRFGKRFVEVTATQKTSVLDDIAWPRRARPEMSQGVAFFNYIRDLTAGGFWSSRIGVRDIGYIGNQFLAEWNGCPPEAMDRLGVNPELMTSRIPFQR